MDMKNNQINISNASILSLIIQILLSLLDTHLRLFHYYKYLIVVEIVNTITTSIDIFIFVVLYQAT